VRLPLSLLLLLHHQRVLSRLRNQPTS
jgi:hypothetical protein